MLVWTAAVCNDQYRESEKHLNGHDNGFLGQLILQFDCSCSIKVCLLKKLMSITLRVTLSGSSRYHFVINQNIYRQSFNHLLCMDANFVLILSSVAIYINKTEPRCRVTTTLLTMSQSTSLLSASCDLWSACPILLGWCCHMTKAGAWPVVRFHQPFGSWECSSQHPPPPPPTYTHSTAVHFTLPTTQHLYLFYYEYNYLREQPLAFPSQ